MFYLYKWKDRKYKGREMRRKKNMAISRAKGIHNKLGFVVVILDENSNVVYSIK